jgi:hypothetical protein
VYIPYVKGVSEKFKRIRMIFRIKRLLRRSLTKTRPERDLQQTAQCVYSIQCECGRSYIGETGRPLAMELPEHRHNFTEDLLEKSKLAQHAYEESHRVIWDEVKISEIESNSRYRKYKELANVACSTNPISERDLEISHICIPRINDVTNMTDLSQVFCV